MFFDNFSLCPGGAFMLHESAAEYDSNVAEAPAEVQDKMIQVKTELEACKDYEAVPCTMKHLRPYYDSCMNYLRSSYKPATREEAMTLLENLSNFASEMVDKLRIMMLKQDTTLKFMTNDAINWVNEPIITQMAFFIRNYEEIVRKGYGTFSYTMKRLPGMDYSMQRAIAIHMKTTFDMVQYPVELDKLMAVASYEKAPVAYSSTDKLMETLFNDPATTARLLTVRNEECSLEQLIDRNAYCGAVIDGCVSDQVTELVRFMSEQMRRIKIACYDAQCKILDHPDDYESIEISDYIRPIIASTVDIFYIAALWTISKAYDIDNYISCHRAVETYVNTVLHVFADKESV